MAVGFNYGEWTISAFPPEDYSVVKTEQGLVRIKRDAETEQRVIHRLTDHGFATAPAVQIGAQELFLYSPAQSAMDSAARWGDFLQNTLLELEQDGWIIDIDESFLLNFQTAQKLGRPNQRKPAGLV